MSYTVAKIFTGQKFHQAQLHTFLQYRNIRWNKFFSANAEEVALFQCNYQCRTKILKISSMKTNGDSEIGEIFS